MSTTVDTTALIRLYESELHAIDEMLSVDGIRENDDDGQPVPTHGRVADALRQSLDLRAENEQFRTVLRDVLKGIDQSEQYERDALRIRHVLGLCQTTGCDNQFVKSGEWADEYCAECIAGD